MKHLASFITNAGKYPFETPAAGDSPARRWLMRQPTPDEAASGASAWRITYSVTVKDKRLFELAGGDEALKEERAAAQKRGDKELPRIPFELEKEARIRARAAEATYMLPLLLETP